MEPVQYLRTIRRRWWIVVGFALVGLVIGGVSGLGAKKKPHESARYRSTCLLYYDSSSISEKGGPFTQIQQMGLLATKGDVPAGIAQAHHLDPNTLTERMAAVVDPSQSTIAVTVVGSDEAETTALANEWCTNLANSINGKNKASFDQQVSTINNQLASLTTQINALTATNPPADSVAGRQLQGLVNSYGLLYTQLQTLAQQGEPQAVLTSLQKAQSARVSTDAYNTFIKNGQLGNNNTVLSASTKNPQQALDAGSGSKTKLPEGPLARGLLGAFLGLILGLIVAFVIERVDTRLHTKEEAELAFALPVLAEVPPLTRGQRHDTEVLSHTHPMSRTAEAYRALRSSLVFLRQTTMGPAPAEGRLSQVIMVTSAGPSEGKTTSVANLATVFAEADYSVLVINCDFRRPRLHRYLGGSDEPRKVVQSDVPGVRMVNNVVSTTSSNPAEVTATQRRVIEAARGIFDIILLDTAPLLSTNDASELISVSDVVVLVARVGRTTRPSAERATEALERLEATVGGVALLGARFAPSGQYYYYATEDGRDPSRAGAESHPLDLLVRADDIARARAETNGAETNGAETNGAEASGAETPASGPAEAATVPDGDRRLEAELHGSTSGGGTSTADE
jgi:Mrp family chromosome partitioning ATPase